jgi:hypothetical protein
MPAGHFALISLTMIFYLLAGIGGKANYFFCEATIPPETMYWLLKAAP